MDSSYSYGSDQADFPNPYRLENYFWGARALIILICALVLLFVCRQQLILKHYGSLAFTTLLAVTLIFIAIANITQVSKQLRVYFGREQPKGLAPQLGEQVMGISLEAKAIQNSIKQGKLLLEIPQGSLNGLLYSICKDLISAPTHVQDLLQNRFANLASYGFMFLIMLITSTLVWGSPLEGWVGLFYSALVALIAIRPIRTADGAAKSSLKVWQIVAMIFFSITGPVLLGLCQKFLPDLSWSNFGTQAYFILIATLLVEAMFFIAILQHVQEPLKNSRTHLQNLTHLKCDPNALVQELDRKLQNDWIDSIPNRKYAYVPHEIDINLKTGSIKSLLIEETQPVYAVRPQALDLLTALREPQNHWLLLINALGVLLTFAGVVVVINFAINFDPSGEWKAFAGLSALGMGLITVGGYAFRGVHTLWGRFDFDSSLICVEIEGNFVRSNVDIGNRFVDNTVAVREQITVENLIVKIWFCRLKSVIFGHTTDKENLTRAVLSMHADDVEAEQLQEHLNGFIENQNLALAREGKSVNDDHDHTSEKYSKFTLMDSYYASLNNAQTNAKKTKN